ncbi:hypothetical protein, variant [Spizellomyces punctatus DAOM BR117]|uniref:Endoplasmic reticulum transmembrane protein n=1 Tax=Spizellomyces punctatus (strain DAOM BR117) TaxID=645134 RepID=A0A0L0HPN2_SPIPD|nr:hypothetical protein, variant [Spizellomyces punctatus DAOM BR117]KND02925.1 hypothetical protein, variant [Spizellomyces punctatus DAOM BR117]|eukprot:XP_016610964.1 hypothetical protein, variant [Spizellomyces punctatus DAOM BR117]
MSLFNQLVYYMLLTELTFYLLTLIPLSFIPIPTRKRIMNSISTLARKDPIVWTARVIFLVMALVFWDTVTRLYRMETEVHPKEEGHHSHLDPMADLQQKARRFYTQRNLYLSLFAIFMILVDYRRVKDLYLQLVYQEEIVDLKKKIRMVSGQVETLTHAAAAVDGEKLEKVISKEEVDGGGVRKRGVVVADASE